MKFLKNIIYNWIGLFVLIVYGFFITPIIVHSLGDVQYGLWNLVASCVGYMVLLDFGINSAINRYFAKSKGLDDKEGINSIYSNALVLYFFIGVLAFIVGSIITINIGRIFQIDPKDLALTQRVMIIMTLFTAFEFPCNVFGSLIYAHQRFDVLNLIQAATLIIQALTVWIILITNHSMLTYAMILVCCGVLKYLIQSVYIHRYVPSLRFRYSYLSNKIVKQLFTFSGITFLALMADYVIYKTDNIVIGIFLTPQAITIYSIGFMLTEYVFTIVGKMCNTLTPVFSEHEARGEKKQLNSLLMTASRFSTLIGIPLGLAAFVVGDSFITLWMGKNYNGAYLIMVLLLISRMAGFPNAPMYSMLFGIGKHYIVLYTKLFEAFVNIILSVVLVRYYGIVGVAIGTVIPMLITNIIFPMIVSKKVGFAFSAWMKNSVILPGVACAVFYLVIKMIDYSYTIATWGDFLILGILIGISYLVVMWFLALKQSERKLIAEKISQFFPMTFNQAG